MERSIDLYWIVSPAREMIDLRVRHLRNQRLKTGIRIKETQPVEVGPVGCVGLQLTVNGPRQPAEDGVFTISRKQFIPIAAPEEPITFQPEPAKMRSSSWTMDPFPHRTVQALQVAVHDEDQIVESFPAGQRQPGDQFGSSISPSPTNAHTRRSEGAVKFRCSRYLRNRA